MTKNEIFETYGKAKNGDRKAQDAIVAEHKVAYPNNYYHDVDDLRGKTDFKQTLHTMYLHLYR